jgi:hypothetical protein
MRVSNAKRAAAIKKWKRNPNIRLVGVFLTVIAVSAIISFVIEPLKRKVIKIGVEKVAPDFTPETLLTPEPFTCEVGKLSDWDVLTSYTQQGSEEYSFAEIVLSTQGIFTLKSFEDDLFESKGRWRYNEKTGLLTLTFKDNKDYWKRKMTMDSKILPEHRKDSYVAIDPETLTYTLQLERAESAREDWCKVGFYFRGVWFQGTVVRIEL